VGFTVILINISRSYELRGKGAYWEQVKWNKGKNK
jgi:hypothetical protein